MNKFLILILSFTLISNLYSEDIIRLGVTVPLSGDYSKSGNYIKEGIEQAVLELQKDNIRVEIYYEDACLPTQAVSSLQRLILYNKIDAVASNFCVIALPAINQLITQHNLPLMQTSVIPEYLTKDIKNIYSTYPAIRHEVKHIANYLFNDLGYKSAAVLSLETPWGIEYSKLFEEYYKDLGGKIVYKSANAISDNDFRPALNRIRQIKPDALFIVHFGSTLNVLLKQIKAFKLEGKLVGVQDAYDQDLIDNKHAVYKNFEFFMPNQKIDINIKLWHPLSIRSYFDTKQLVKTIISCKHDRACANHKLSRLFNKYKDNSPTFIKYSIK